MSKRRNANHAGGVAPAPVPGNGDAGLATAGPVPETKLYAPAPADATVTRASVLLAPSVTIIAFGPYDAPSPWLVRGTTSPAAASMAYQINDGLPAMFSPPLGGSFANWSLTLSEGNLPAPGSYLLTVYAWNSSGQDVGVASKTVTRLS